ncbi:(E2-independent) E3 ubiquitin-conjugating enzyme FATS isoform X2 [Hoplias malabaricus]|uniref:(E2-independent) E3 ubiquitin-conjugating enzyme FATS isoform X2 n=1 Tax=Hoplias malabaricus TaxID=27720 RepID=UPI003461C3EA
MCYLAPVRIGWLPIQRRVVMTNSPTTAHHHGNTSQVKLKPPITPVISSGPVRTSGSDTGAQWSGARLSSGAQQPWRIPGHGSTQAAGSGNCAPAERDQDTARDPSGRGQMPRSQNSKLQHNSLLWTKTAPGQRRGSMPQSSPFIPPLSDGSPDTKHCSSISSITITSRRVVRSSSLPDTSLPPQAGSPMTINSQQTDPAKFLETQYTSQVPPHRKAVVVKVTEHKERSTAFQPSDKKNTVDAVPCNQTPGENSFSNLITRRSPCPAIFNLSSTENRTLPALVNETTKDNLAPGISRESHSSSPSNLTTPETHHPVVLRRKATIVKVEHRESVRRESKERAEHRQSYTEGFRATSSVTYTSNPSHTSTAPPLANEPQLAGFENQALGYVQPRRSNEKVKELHRSTLSFQLSSPSSRSNCWEVLRPRRPASCYARMFSPTEPSTDASDPGFQSTSSALPKKTNIDPLSSGGSGSNRRWSTGGGAGSRDEIYPGRDSTAGDVGQRQKESTLLGNQPPLTLIKVPESSTNAAYDAVMALNAAAVIANIKKHSQQRKRAQTHSSIKREVAPLSQSKPAESGGGDKVSNGELGSEVSLPLETETAACVRHWHAEFVPFQNTDKSSSNINTLSKALEQRRPDFIRRSQARVHALQQHTQERLQLRTTTSSQTPVHRQRDNIFKSQDRSVSVKQLQQLHFRNHSDLPEVKRRKEEESRKLTSQTNRLRAELFKKKILEQVLHRGKD